MGNKTSIHITKHSSLWEGLGGLLLFLLLAVSCSESDDEAADEFANWQERNDAYFATLEDSLFKAMSSSLATQAFSWKKIKTYTKDETAQSKNTDYIYVKVLASGDQSTASPLYSDSVRVAYRGRLIPSVTYPEGYVFDQTYTGDYHIETTGVANKLVSGYIDGFSTAIQHMHKGDYWRIYIPYPLGYGSSGTTGVPGYSVLIFDLALIDFATAPDILTPWTSRQP